MASSKPSKGFIDSLSEEIVRCLDRDGRVDSDGLKIRFAYQLPSILTLRELTTISCLAYARSVQDLTLNRCSVVDITAFATMPLLSKLRIDSCEGIADISPLAKAPSLHDLSMGQCSIVDLSPLANAQFLQKLHLMNSKVADISALGRIKTLQQLHLNSCMCVDDISSLAEAPRLRVLKLRGSTTVVLTS